MESPASWDLLTASIAVCNVQHPFAAWAFLVVQGLVRDAVGDREVFVAVVEREKDRDITGYSVARRVASSLREAEIALETAEVSDPWAKIASERLEVLTSWKAEMGGGAQAPRRKSWWKFWRGGLAAFLVSGALLLFSACASQPESPENQVRALLAQAEAAAEQRDIDALEALVAETYRDERGNTRASMIRRANFYFLQNRSIHLLTRVDSLTLIDSTHATASVLVAMAGQPIENGGVLSLARASIYRFAFTVVDEGDGMWKVVHAAWQRATEEDFF